MFPAGELGFDFKEERQMISSLNKKELSLSRGRARGHWRVAVALVTAMTVVFLFSCGGGSRRGFSPWEKVLKNPITDLEDLGVSEGSTSLALNGPSSEDLLRGTSGFYHLWNHTLGGVDNDFGYGVDVDEFGDIYVVGRTLSFGLGGDDMVILKYSPDGTFYWGKTWGTPYGGDWAEDVVVNGNYIYIAGTMTVDAGSYTHQDAVILKLTLYGDLIWGRRYGKPGMEVGYAVDVDSEENVYIAVTYEPRGGVADTQAIAVKYDRNGNLKWDLILSEDYEVDDYAYSVLVEEPYLYVGGATMTVGSGDAYVVKVGDLASWYPSIVWQKHFGDSNHPEEARGISLDNAGNIYVAGTYFYSKEGEDRYGTLTYSLSPDAGDYQWHAAVEDAFGLGIEVYDSRVFVTGIRKPVGTPGASAVLSQEQEEVMLLEYRTFNGSLLQSSEWGSDTYSETGHDIAIYTDSYNLPLIYITGSAPYYNNYPEDQWSDFDTPGSVTPNYGDTEFTAALFIASSSDPTIGLVEIEGYTENRLPPPNPPPLPDSEVLLIKSQYFY